MAKLSKQDAKLHAQACELLQQNELTYDERVFVLDNWQESATHINSVAGAFFTPRGLARDLAIEVTPRKIVDLCAGIGVLSFAVHQHFYGNNPEITCVEINPDYIEVGKKLVPEARWIRADTFDFAEVGFDCAIANPPFGNVKTHKNVYGCFEYDLIAHAKSLARYGVFIIPQMSSPFKLSGNQRFEEKKSADYLKFRERSGVSLTPNCGLDTSVYREDWKVKTPMVEIVLGFTEEE